MDGGRWRRMLGEALPGLSLDAPRKKGRKPRVQMLRELLQREGAVRQRRVGLGRSKTGKRQGPGARGLRRDGQTGCEERCRGGGRGGSAKEEGGEGGL